MSNTIGRPRRDRLRAMRFALWAQHEPMRDLTPERIGAVLDVGIDQARRWRAELLAALSPMEAPGMAPFRPAAHPHDNNRTTQ